MIGLEVPCNTCDKDPYCIHATTCIRWFNYLGSIGKGQYAPARRGEL